MKNRIEKKFELLRAESKKAFVAYIAAGDPHLEITPSLVCSLEKGGADIVELGIPFSDPLADGVVNQLAAQRALEAGSTIQGVFNAIKEVRRSSEIPLVLFTYYNPVFRYGTQKFFDAAHEAGADGILILDLPPDEADFSTVETPLARIPLLSPTSPIERIEAIAPQASGFIYYVSREGVTGMREGLPPSIQERIDAIRKVSQVPVCAGFGVSTPEQAQAVAQCADGVVIGSVLVNQIAERAQEKILPQHMECFARKFAEAIHQKTPTKKAN